MDCGRLFIDDPGLPLFAGFGDYIEIPQGRCEGGTDNLDSIDRYCGKVLSLYYLELLLVTAGNL